MTHKIVYQLDEHGYFINEIHADESPLEPGVFLIPAGCTELEPPAVVQGKSLRLVANTWVYEDIPEQSAEANYGSEPDSNAAILVLIQEIETTKQPRAVRDFILNGDRTMLEAIDQSIADLRAQLIVKSR